MPDKTIAQSPDEHYIKKPAQRKTDANLRNFNDLPDCACVRVQTVSRLFGFSVSHTWKLSREGRIIPKAIKLSDKVTVWNVGALRAALDAVMAEGG